MFDPDAFEQAWVNACVHNKWAVSNHPGVYIYEDRLVIESQGGIPKSLTKEKFLKGVSEPVNKALMDIFIKCDFCEESGHGVPTKEKVPRAPIKRKVGISYNRKQPTYSQIKNYIKDNKIYMVHSLVYDYYKFPGGGIEKDESTIDALIRETKEEAGLIVIKDSIKEYGYVHRVQKADEPSYSKFIQDNFYYICDVENKKLEQQLDDYENFEKFTLELVNPKIAININRNKEHGPKDLDMIERV